MPQSTPVAWRQRSRTRRCHLDAWSNNSPKKHFSQFAYVVIIHAIACTRTGVALRWIGMSEQPNNYPHKPPFKTLGKYLKTLRQKQQESLGETSGAVEI